MKKTFILALIFSLISCISLQALDFSRGPWWALNKENRIFLKLKKYGHYNFRTGDCLEGYTPQGKNLCENMQLVSDKDGTRLMWGDTDEGSWSYRISIDDDVIHLTGRRPLSGGPWQSYEGWIKILKWEDTEILTVDNNDVYRIFDVFERQR